MYNELGIVEYFWNIVTLFSKINTKFNFQYKKRIPQQKHIVKFNHQNDIIYDYKMLNIKKKCKSLRLKIRLL